MLLGADDVGWLRLLGGDGLMNPFKSFTDLAGNISGLLQGARGLMDRAGGEGYGEGLKGMVQSMLDLNLEGIKDSVDSHIGAGVMRLTIAGETERVETAVRFRNYVVMRLDELMEVRDIGNRFISQDISQVTGVVDQMATFLEKKQPETTYSVQEEVLEQEINKLRKLQGEMSRFLDGEQAMVEAGSSAGPTEVTTVEQAVEVRSPTAKGLIVPVEKSVSDMQRGQM